MRKILLLTFIAGNIFFLSTSVLSSDWKYITNAEDEEEFYLDSNNIRYDGHIVTYWDKMIDRKRKLQYKTRTSINCKNKTFTIKDSIMYSTKGYFSRRDSFQDKDLKWRGIRPDSIVEKFQKILCKDR